MTKNSELGIKTRQQHFKKNRPDYDIILKYRLLIPLNCFKLLVGVGEGGLLYIGAIKTQNKAKMRPSNVAKSFGKDRTNEASELKVEQRIWRRYKQIDKDTGPLRNLALGLLLDL